ncbi:SREBP regulating gene protein [Toxorhynchites rutilus septentrionalis]|uniref:SREBP regulating gene protein n=1 Tax=Toxorhynchites rutilus septentrionalis TaxID=329112 RepID=UPI002479C90C|nr:SREBP regulating gene protein [Toxorhynchites rutilus septentrionalis]
MWYAVITRFLRRRVVLAIIFCLSLTYCMVRLIGNNVSLNLDGDLFQSGLTREKPIEWTNSVAQDRNRSNDLSITCRNSVQGKALIVDDRGFVCTRSELLWTGCCNLEVESTKLFHCDTCQDSNCCEIYEHCVSCCMHPEKKILLEKVLAKASGRQIAVYATVNDQYELCLTKCRTNSHSVQNENKYRDPKLKYCFGETEEKLAVQNNKDVANSAVDRSDNSNVLVNVD